MALCSCHVVIVNMNHTPSSSTFLRPKSHHHHHLFRFSESNHFVAKWRLPERRRFNVIVASAGADLTNPFSVNIGLDSQVQISFHHFLILINCSLSIYLGHMNMPNITS